ncbi:MAG: copper-binding protein [Candidatus Sulfotelmatobacter sp.]
MSGQYNATRSRATVLLLGVLILCVACNRGKPQQGEIKMESVAKRYPFKGKVVSIDKQAGVANIDNEPIPGFMDAMVMGYTIKPAARLNQLQPGDSITADVVVQGEDSWLENVTLIQHAAAHPAS